MMGIVEGFYGPPWSWRDRVDVLQWSAARGLTDYMYAPKDDPKHRRAWREPYDADEVVGFRSLVDQAGVRIGFAISPGLSIDEASSSDRGALAAKVDQIVDLGVTHVGLFLDDLPPDPSRTPAEQGAAHAGLATWLRDHLEGRATPLGVPDGVHRHAALALPHRVRPRASRRRARRMDRRVSGQRRDHGR